jgi:ParB family chromosome partitioning protein
VKEAEKAIAGRHERSVQIAAHILGRAGAKKSGKAVAAALETWRGAWEEHRRRMAQTNSADDQLTSQITPCLTRLYWAAGRLGAAEEALLAAVSDRPGDPYFRPLRLAAVAALCDAPTTKPAQAALAAAVAGDDAEVRSLAASALSRSDGKQKANLAASVLSDPIALDRLAVGSEGDFAPALRPAAAKIHYQGVALPHLIAAGDVEGLYSTACDKTLSETTRLGAVEALAKLGREEAEGRLVALGQDQGNEEELRKAAWRGRRRSQRAREKVSVKK